MVDAAGRAVGVEVFESAELPGHWTHLPRILSPWDFVLAPALSCEFKTMDVGSNPSVIVLIVLVAFLAIFGPPAWWYTRGRRPGERREKRWGAILLGILMIVSISYVQPSVRGDWFGWSANMARVVGGVWLLAWGAKGARVA